MTAKGLLKEFAIGQADAKWVARHFDRLAKKFEDEFIAVHGKRVIGHHPDARILGNRLRKSHPEEADEAYVTYISSEKVNLVL